MRTSCKEDIIHICESRTRRNLQIHAYRLLARLCIRTHFLILKLFNLFITTTSITTSCSPTNCFFPRSPSNNTLASHTTKNTTAVHHSSSRAAQYGKPELTFHRSSTYKQLEHGSRQQCVPLWSKTCTTPLLHH